ncbi:MAG: hypothetical protein FWC50_00125 [Planctomycetaceae bacterium]|nr:hypothetical protein [Planctomycetaceae bacterium]
MAAGPLKMVGGLFGAGEKVDADPDKDYTLDETSGPWMIYVRSYEGENAKEDAKTLALELRKRYKMKAYIHERTDDLTKGVQYNLVTAEDYAIAQGNIQDLPVKKRTKRLLHGNISKGYAVLVGDFQSIDDKDINETLEQIKTSRPECVIAQLKRESEGKKADKGAFITAVRIIQRTQDNNNVSPLAWAFKCTNPLLPEEYFNSKYVDSYIEALNSDTDYSLLRCPGKYTMQVAEFFGNTTMMQDQVKKLEEDETKLHEDGKLVEAAKKAEKLCHALRLKGYEAYSFHSATNSIVAVGSFDSLGTTDPAGVTHFSPEVRRIFERFSVDQAKTNASSYGPGAIVTQTFVGIELMPQPIPIEVPKSRPKYMR